MNTYKIRIGIRYENYLFLSLLLLCCLIAYWPLTFYLFSLKNDALNYFLPVRYQISQAIYNGEWPFWSPYFNLGYPLHGDMQSGAWNPFVQLFSLFGTYTLKTLQYETLLYVFISGVSMFFLLSHFVSNKSVVFFGAASYMLCGYTSDSAQFIYWICSASFIPFVVLFYYRTLTENSLKAAVYCGFFFYLLFVSAYPGDFIIMSYLMAILLIWKLFSKDINQDNFVSHLKNHFVLITVFVLLSLPAIISYIQFFGLAQRGTGIPIESALSNSLHPKLLVSYLTPLAIWNVPGVEVTDKLERNSYIGFIGCFFLLLSFFIKTNHGFIKFSRVAALVFLLFSFGAFGGIRTLAYYTLPLMDTFRHPANAKIFTTLFACILFSFTLHQVVMGAVKLIYLKVVAGIILLLFVFLFIWGSQAGYTFYKQNLVNYFHGFGIEDLAKQLIDNWKFSDLLFLNILIQLPFSLVLWLFCFKKSSLKILICAGVINSVLHTMLFQPFTVVKKDSATSIQSILSKLTSPGYSLPSLNNSLKENSKDGFQYFKEIGIANLYNNKIGRVDYSLTPSNLHTQETFWNNKEVRNIIMQYPLFYKADSAVHINDSANAHFSMAKKYVLLQNTQTIQAINSEGIGESIIQLTHFSPNKWNFRINASTPGFYSLIQNYYPRWTLYINGKKSEIISCNISFIGFMLPAGVHNASLKYETTDIKIAFFISLALFIAIIVMPIIHKRA